MPVLGGVGLRNALDPSVNDPPLALFLSPPQLEATLDLTERRQIRSAIRELRRQELERDEEALASKRFRTERQENKENRLR